MGYARTLEVGDSLDIGGTLANYVLLSTAPINDDFGSFYMPSTLTASIKYAFVDFIIGWWYSDNINANWLDGDLNITATYNGTQTCMTLLDGFFYCPAAMQNRAIPGIRLYGKTNIKNRIAAGQTTTFTFTGGLANQDTLYIQDIQPVLRIVFN